MVKSQWVLHQEFDWWSEIYGALFQVDQFFETSIKIIFAHLNNLLIRMRQISIVGSEPHSRYFLSSLVDLGHYLVLNDRCLDIDGEIADLEAGL